MKRKFHHFKSSSRRFSFDRNRNFRFGRKQTSFDPSLLVQKPVEEAPRVEYQPTHTFADFSLCDQLNQNINSHGYSIPTPIQDQAIPHLLLGKDVVGIANTGTGKTAAFLIPLINKINFNRSEKVLIITPTRELADQIQQECQSLVRGIGIFSLLCIGGVGMFPQIQGLRRNPNIVIGTPGRLKDLFNRRNLNFFQYKTIVLDEVDRMLDMGFIPDIKLIISQLPKDRQSLFFSATIPPAVQNIMSDFLRNPVTISVKTHETPANIAQDIVKVNGRIKLEVLHDLLIQKGFDKVLIFGRTKWGIERLAKQLNLKGFRCASLHGNKKQNQRQRALEDFKYNKVSILLATDIASRGLDITNVTHVINYDLPKTYEDYIHRIGRTGRVDKKGVALSFVD